MREVLERKDRRQDIPYESDADKTDEVIVKGLMEITALSLTDFLADESAYKCGGSLHTGTHGRLRGANRCGVLRLSTRERP